MVSTRRPGVRPTIVDRAVGWFSPAAGLRRYSSRVTMANLQRLYDGAAGGRGTEGWRARGTSADTEIAIAGAELRDRMRDLVRNNPLAANAVQVLVNNIVGAGIRPRPKTGNKRHDAKVLKVWERWTKDCDIHGRSDFYGLLSLGVREMVEGGEVFAVRRRLKAKPGRVPLQIELFEADHLDDARVSYGATDPKIRDGIEYDGSGRRAAYFLLPEHPGSNHVRTRYDSVRVPADDVVHLFERQRLQNRGVPWGVPALRAVRDHGDWQLAEMVRKKTEACMVGVVLGDDGTAGGEGINPIQDADGNSVEQFRPGMLYYADGAKDVKFNTPAHTGGIAEWNRVQMHLIAAGFRVPYALMTGDLSQANFSSNRAGLNEFRRLVDTIQWLLIIPVLCQRIWDWFCEAAFSAGLIHSADVPVEWGTPKFESVNPKQDAETDLLEVRAGFASRSAKIAARGYDAREVEAEIAEDNASADNLKLIFDSDPRHTSRAGQGQNGEKPADDEKDEQKSPSGDEKEAKDAQSDA